jgi:hypothetical protein
MTAKQTSLLARIGAELVRGLITLAQFEDVPERPARRDEGGTNPTTGAPFSSGYGGLNRIRHDVASLVEAIRTAKR